MRIKQPWLRGGIIGLLLPIALFELFYFLVNILGSNLITGLLMVIIALLELPAATIGRLLKLPIESGGTAFGFYDFTVYGYTLTLIFWVAIGMLFGWLMDFKSTDK